MALSNTLFAGLSGLNVNQTKLNVVGNNIANVNTVAFKGSRAMFRPQFYVTDNGGSQPVGDFGGSNPSQRGLGATVAGIEKNFAGGSIESTGRATDMAIDGEGFFVVRSDELKYTRDGSFKLNANNMLVTSSGDFVQGYGVDPNFQVIQGSVQNLNIPLGAATTAQATSSTRFVGNLNAAGAVGSGASILMTQALTVVGGAATPTAATVLTNIAAASDSATALFSVGDVLTLGAKKGGRELQDETFTVAAGTTLGDLQTFFEEALGINMSVPDDGNALTPPAGVTLETHGTDPANSTRLVVTGNLGAANEIELANGSFTTAGNSSPLSFAEGTNLAGIASDPAGESVRTTFVVYDSLGTPINVHVTAVLESTATTGNTWRFFVESATDSDLSTVVGMGTLTFDNEGQLLDSTGTSVTIDRNGAGPTTPLTFDLDFSRMTQLTDTRSDMVMANQDGSPIGTLVDFSIGADGVISGSFSNGARRTLGQVALATFANPQGLVDRGGNMYVEGAASGNAVVSAANAMGSGKIVAGALELSNVDLSEEFINLIIASTGFSAASRVISTSDQLITELLNTSR